MRFLSLLALCSVFTASGCDRINRQLLSYAAVPDGVYVPQKNTSIVTLLDLAKSRRDLSILASVLGECGGKFTAVAPIQRRTISNRVIGFLQAFDTAPQWSYTFFAPSNTAFNNTGEYFNTFVTTPKGKWWLGNLIQHHYVPNSQLRSTAFTASYTRIQTGSFLYIGTQVIGGQLILNNVSSVTTADLPVTSVSVLDGYGVSSADGFRGLCT